MTGTTEERERRLAEREGALADARAVLRRERDAISAQKAETGRLLADARNAHRTADRERARARRLAARFARQLRHTLAKARAQLDADRGAINAQVERLNATRSEFHAAGAAERDRLRDAWAGLDERQKRIAAEWDEANRHFAEQSAALDARAAELGAREAGEDAARSAAQRELAALREEAAGLDVRVRNARQSVEELERQRERLRAEALAPIPTTAEPPEALKVALDRAADRDLAQWAAELAQREERLNVEKAAVAAVFANVSRDRAGVEDQRRVLAEQFAQLASARAKWQEVERATVVEMEQLARTLRRREAELDAREQRLVRADARRRDDAADLWQLRLRLEAWQSKLVACEARWHTERERLEADAARREQALRFRESLLEDTFARWDRERAVERERVNNELARWSADRDRMLAAAEAHDRQRAEALGELASHAARALAAEELVNETIRDSGSGRAARRMAVLRTRWERHFGRKLREVSEVRAATAAELAALDARHRELHTLIAGVAERVAAFNSRGAAVERAAVVVPMAAPVPEAEPPAIPAELVALRDEVERMAAVLIEAELPEPPEPAESELPWGSEDAPSRPEAQPPSDPDILRFPSRHARAA